MFYIIDQGARIQTPLDRLLEQKGVAQVSALSGVHAVTAEGVNPAEVDKTAKQPIDHNAYQQAEPDHQRTVVVYAHQIMTTPVVTASVNQTLEEIWTLFSKRGFHHLPLVDNQQHIQGIVSDRDILRFAANRHREVGDHRINELMSRSVITAAEQTEVRVLAEVMCRQSIGAIPIEDEELNLVGIVSRSDILRTLVNRAPLELWV